MHEGYIPVEEAQSGSVCHIMSSMSSTRSLTMLFTTDSKVKIMDNIIDNNMDNRIMISQNSINVFKMEANSSLN